MTAADLPRLRHSVVLVHGLLGFARWALGETVVAEYFRGIPARLTAAKIRVVVPELPPTGSIAGRAEVLASAVREEVARVEAEEAARVASGAHPLPASVRGLDTGSVARVHIVAHSMGGLDARHAITHLGLAPHVVSLTTLGTPHRGSPVANRGTDVAARLGFLGAIRKCGVDTAAFHDLRTDSCAAFNAATPDMPGVVYRSFAGRKERRGMAPPLRRTQDLVEETEGPNDGLVSVASAKWGSVSQVVDADHIDLVGWTPAAQGIFGRPSDVPGIWFRVIDGLRVVERGAAIDVS